jgi:hypothetical protein
MQYSRRYLQIFFLTLFFPLCSFSADIPEKTFNAPHDMKMSIKQVSPITQSTDLQIITLLKHNTNGDKYLEAMNYLNKDLGHLLSSLRERGEFIGDLGDTFLFIPPSNSISPKRVLLIGLGDENSLSLDKLKIAGRIAAREAVRLQAKQVSFAPTLRDQGSNAIDVGDGDAAIAEQVILAYDTEKRLQKHHLAPNFDIKEWTIEAGPSYFDNVVDKVDSAIQSATSEISARGDAPLVDKMPTKSSSEESQAKPKKTRYRKKYPPQRRHHHQHF